MENIDTYKSSDLPDLSQDLKTLALTFLGGSFAGVANVLIGHPLDTLKVSMQVFNMPLFRCGREIFKQQGFLGFYKGLASPLYTVPICYAIVMGGNEAGRWMQGVSFDQEMTFSQGAIAGAWAGLASCIIVTPMELVKCQLQIEDVPKGGKGTAAWTLTKDIYKEKGVKGLFKGNVATILREVPGLSIYFAVYEDLKKRLKTSFGDGHYVSFVAGGIAGFMSWVVSYPQDIVKTKLQCGWTGSGNLKYQQNRWLKDGGFMNCTREIWRTEGMRGFWHGFSACALRSLVSEAFTFFVYEQAKERLLSAHRPKERLLQI